MRESKRILILFPSMLALIFLMYFTPPLIMAEESDPDTIIGPLPEENPIPNLPKPDPKPDPKPKPEPKPDPKPEPKPEPKPKSDPKPDPKPGTKPDPKPDPKPKRDLNPNPNPNPKTNPTSTPKSNNTSGTSTGTTTKTEKPKTTIIVDVITGSEDENDTPIEKEAEIENANEDEDTEVKLGEYSIGELVKMMKSGTVKGEVNGEKYFIISEDGTEQREVTEKEAIKLGIIEEDETEEPIEEDIEEDITVVEDNSTDDIIVEPVATDVKSANGKMPLFVSAAGLVTILGGGLMYFVQWRRNAN